MTQHAPAGQGQHPEVIQQRGHKWRILDGGQHILHPKALGQLRNDHPRAVERLNQQLLAVGQVGDVDQLVAIHRQILVEQALGVFTLGL